MEDLPHSSLCKTKSPHSPTEKWEFLPLTDTHRQCAWQTRSLMTKTNKVISCRSHVRWRIFVSTHPLRRPQEAAPLGGGALELGWLAEGFGGPHPASPSLVPSSGTWRVYLTWNWPDTVTCETALLLVGDAVRADRLRLRDERAPTGGGPADEGVAEGVGVGVDVEVCVRVAVNVPMELTVRVGVKVGVQVRLGVGVGLGVGVEVGVVVGVGVGVDVDVDVGVGRGVKPGVHVASGVPVCVIVGVRVGEKVDVGTGVDVDVRVGVCVGEVVGVTEGNEVSMAVAAKWE